MTAPAPLTDPVLRVPHGFGVRGAPVPPGLVRPRQVHGIAVVEVSACRDAAEPPAADGIVSDRPGLAVGVVTADCVPVLLADASGAAVAALHAGWRGLAAGVLEAGVLALTGSSRVQPAALRAAIGPHIGPCCYEVDAPVLDALAARYGAAVAGASQPVRPGHAMLDLGACALEALRGAGLAADHIGTRTADCTRCDAERFHSYRRDGPAAGRLVHFVAAIEA